MLEAITLALTLIFAPLALASPTDDQCNPTLNSGPGCAFVRLDCPGGSMAKIRIRNQGDFGVCEAYSMAQMVDAIRFEDASAEIQTSAIEAALGSIHFENSKSPSQDPQSWEIEMIKQVNGKDVLEYLKRNGVYDDSKTREPRTRLGQTLNGYFIGRLQNLKADFDFLSGNTQTFKQKAHSCFEKVNLRIPPEQVLAIFEETSPNLLVRDLLAPGAGEKTNRTPIPQNLTYEEFQNFPKDFEKIQAHLIQKKQPVQIGFCSGLFEDENPAFRGFLGKYSTNPKTKAKEPILNNDCGAHSAIAIGQAFIDGSCRTLVRNSSGKSCKHYHPKFQNHCDENGVWIENQLLNPNTFDMGYINRY